MKRLLFILILFIAAQAMSAPGKVVLLIVKDTPINFYDPLIQAVTWVESMDGQYTYNPKENAVGWFQIRQIRVDDYNQRTGSNYVLEDFYDYKLSREMFLYFAQGRSYEEVARSWNGSGEQTIEYWEKVQKEL